MPPHGIDEAISTKKPGYRRSMRTHVPNDSCNSHKWYVNRSSVVLVLNAVYDPLGSEGEE